MTNLKTINFMSQDKFSELIETSDDEVYFVDAENFGMPDRDNYFYIGSGYVAENAGIIKLMWNGKTTSTNKAELKVNSESYYLSNNFSGASNVFETFVLKGDVIIWSATNATVESVKFFPLKGY